MKASILYGYLQRYDIIAASKHPLGPKSRAPHTMGISVKLSSVSRLVRLGSDSGLSRLASSRSTHKVGQSYLLEGVHLC